ncbi:Arm DNA-binding domain-containing protein [Microbacterium sp. ANT_H45B]|uniref:Arm DNA-binding domain-containing protein n=1 Tax=Microbacterium sp. ANT_H45B TaxID=2597346 RepID=UPI003977DA67
MAGSITPYETAGGRRHRVRYRKPDKSQTDKRGFRTKKEAELFLASVTVSKATGEYFDPKTRAGTISAAPRRAKAQAPGSRERQTKRASSGSRLTTSGTPQPRSPSARACM